MPKLSESKSEDAWAGRTGFAHSAVTADLPDLSAYQVCACSMPIMVDSARLDVVAT